MFLCCASGLSTALPPKFKFLLVNSEVAEGKSVVLLCELNKPAPLVEWRRGDEVLNNGDKYQMKKKDLQLEMRIVDVTMADAGEYSCICGEEKTTASLTVNGEYCELY